MKPVMKILFLMVIFLAQLDASGQFRSPVVAHYSFAQPVLAASKKTVIPGLRTDPWGNYRMMSPLMIASSGYDWRMQNNFFWTGNVTTMSYNQGKFGTYFYWDVQGNLRGTRGFIDISGKNKRGLKLTFLWRSVVKNKF
jgi:hypothetical protein